MKKLTLKITVPILLTFALAVALYYTFTIYPNLNQSRTVDNVQPGSSVTEPPAAKDPRNEVVETYISLMEQERRSMAECRL